MFLWKYVQASCGLLTVMTERFSQIGYLARFTGIASKRAAAINTYMTKTSDQRDERAPSFMDTMRERFHRWPTRQTHAVVHLPAPQSKQEELFRWDVAHRWCEQKCVAPWSAHTEYEQGWIVYGFASELDAMHFRLAFP